MKQYSTREVAKKLGLSLLSIQRYIAAGKIPVPPGAKRWRRQASHLD